MEPTFTPISNPKGLRINDPIENAQMDVYTQTTAYSAATDHDVFLYPVDTAVELVTDSVRVPRLHTVYVRNHAGELVGESSNREEIQVGDGSYNIDVSTGQLKLYIAAASALTVRREDAETVIEFPEPTTIQFGVRSLHETPATTITVRETVEDVMQAISLLGSALKTHTPERSFPTLRGHPPLVEFGDAFHAPDGLEVPSTGVTIELPPEFEYVYPASSLAYYLGATLVPADTPALVVDDTRDALPAGDGYESAMERLLKRIFFLDCLVRTEGIYPVTLHERRAFSRTHDLDFRRLYEAPEAERIAAYMDVPYDDIEPHLPTWKVTTDIQPTAEHADVLPFVANDLSLVRCPTPDEDVVVQSEPEALTSFYRADGGLVRDSSTTESPLRTENIVHPEPVSSLEHAWVGEGFPLGASKVSAESYRRRLAHIAGDKPYISVDIVCNDPEMSEEDVVKEYYGLREFFQFDVSVSYETTCEELADHLRDGCDFFHYIGHVDEEGFQCSDGMLDARTLDEVNVEAFLLNACRSYEQGAALVDRGSLGGIVTLAKVLNEPAVKIGRALARALNAGFSLQSGLNVAREESTFGNQYISIGDGNLQLVKSENGTSFLATLTPNDGEVTLDLKTFPTASVGMGSMVMPHVKGNKQHYINAGHIDRFVVTTAELREFFELGITPVLVDGELHWSDELDPETLI